MIRRPRRSTPATIVAALLLALCVLVIVAVVQSLLGQTPLLTLDELLAVSGALTWTGAVTITVAILAALLGLVLLVVALRPGKPTVLPLGAHQGPDGQPGADAGVRRHTLAKDLATAVSGVSGISDADISVRRNTITARVRVAAVDPAAVPDLVRERIDARVLAIGPATRPRVRVRARADKNT